MADSKPDMAAAPTSPALRLLADDLTGALDTAAELVPLAGPIATFWPDALPGVLPALAAWDSATRELTPEAAIAAIDPHLPALAAGALAFKKIDSLLRGPTLAEIAACLRSGAWNTAVLAPAFPFQGRITRGGVQHRRGAAGWEPVGGDLVARLRAEGVPVRRGQPGTTLAGGAHVFDAETDSDLQAVVETGRRTPGRVLWIGTGGLAQALAASLQADGAEPTTSGGPPPALPLPILGLFGSDQSVTQAQLAACAPHWVRLTPAALASNHGPIPLTNGARAAAGRGGSPNAVDGVRDRLARDGRALVSVDLPSGLDRATAAARIAAELGALVSALPAPGTLVVAGGETLRTLCRALGATSLSVRGRLVPGLPWSVLQGGPWNGVTVISKSGAFGPPSLLRDLLASPHLALERTG